MRIMRRLLSERKGLFATNLGLRLVKDLLPFIGPILVGIAVDLLSGTDRSFLGISLTTNDVRSIVIVAIAMGALAVLKVIFGYVHTLVAAHMGRHVVEAARRDLAEASMQMALDRRRSFNTGDLLDRSLADTKGLRTFTQNVIIRLISNTVRAIVPLTLMFSIDPVMALIVLAVIPLQSGLSGLLQRRLQRETRDARARESEHTSSVKEAIDGWNSLASVSGQDWVTKELKATASASEDAKIVKKRTTASISAVINLFTALGIASLYGIGGWRIIESGALDGTGDVAAGALTLGTLTTFIGVAKKTYAPFQAYTKIVSSYRTGLVNLERIAEVLEAPMVDQRRNGPELTVTDGEITLRDVSFSYKEGDTPTLRQLSGTIPGNSLTVITGSSGAGKTTLLRLLMGLDVPDAGAINIDGQDINIAKLSSVQQAVVLVPQEPMLFTGTLAENLLLGHPDVSTEDLLSACHRAGLLEMVRELPDGLGTALGSGRHVLSGGQLRRMAIARALLRKPAVLLLDEPTAGLDDVHSAQVLETLREIGERTTVVMVSHRRGPLEASDHHLILHDGVWTKAEAAASTAAFSLDDWLLFPGGDGEQLNGSAGTANGHTSNGVTGPANGTPGEPGSNGASNALLPHPLDDHVVGLSALGRPISINSLDHKDAKTRLMMVGGHRADTSRAQGFLPRLMAAVAAQAENTVTGAAKQADVAVATIRNLNPDSAWVSDHRTALGVNLAADHRERLSVETRVFHDALDAWATDLIIDVAQSPRELPTAADVEIRFHYVPASDGSAPGWLTRTALDVGQRLKDSRHTSHITLTPGLPESVTAVRGIPLIELTSTNDPDLTTERESLEALVEATLATYEAVAAAEQEPAGV